jgi:hypothetical protein
LEALVAFWMESCLRFRKPLIQSTLGRPPAQGGMKQFLLLLLLLLPQPHR